MAATTDQAGRTYLTEQEPEEQNAADDDAALVPAPLDPNGFNLDVRLPYGLLVEHVESAMQDFLNFLGYINEELHTRGIDRQELLMEPAEFSGLVGGFMVSGVPKHCPTLAKNNYHNGHPDMLPKGRYPDDSIAHANEGIEVKASRRPSSWQGHNPEASWLMVFQSDSNKVADLAGGVEPRPFRFRSCNVCPAGGSRLDVRWSLRDQQAHHNGHHQQIRDAEARANWIYRVS
jgi:hypothetical protein